MNAIHSSDFENLPLEELVTLSTDLDQMIKKKRREKSKQIRTQMNELARVAGFESVEEFMESQGGRMTRSDKGVKLPPKYRNPDNHEKTWSGKGPTPKWLRDLESQGRHRDQFLIHS